MTKVLFLQQPMSDRRTVMLLCGVTGNACYPFMWILRNVFSASSNMPINNPTHASTHPVSPPSSLSPISSTPLSLCHLLTPPPPPPHPLSPSGAANALRRFCAYCAAHPSKIKAQQFAKVVRDADLMSATRYHPLSIATSPVDSNTPCRYYLYLPINTAYLTSYHQYLLPYSLSILPGTSSAR